MEGMKDAVTASMSRRNRPQELSPQAAPRGLLGEVRAAAAASAAARQREEVDGGEQNGAALSRKSGSFTFGDVLVRRETPSRYEIHECCGKGAFGSVFRATDTREKTTVAIKFVTAVARRKWCVEATIGDRLRHPNIARMLDHYMDGDSVALVYEYAPDMDLYDWIVEFHTRDKHGTVGLRTPGVASLVIREAGVMAALQSALTTCDRLSDVDDTAPVTHIVEVHRDCIVLPLNPGAKELVGRHIARQLVSALAYCHRRGTSHMDMKPGNVRICHRNFNVKLLDFGLGSVYWNADASKIEGGVYGGSPQYAAPEILLQASKIDTHIADMWGLGATLFATIHGYNAYCVEIKRGCYCTTSWQRASTLLSHECLSFLRGLLCESPEKRMDAQATARHPWITGETTTTTDDDDDDDDDTIATDDDVVVDGDTPVSTSDGCE